MRLKVLSNDYFFSVISKGIGVVAGILYVALFSRYFGVDLKGRSAVILNYVAIFCLIFDFGIGQSYAYFRKQNEQLRQGFLSIITRIFVLYLLCMTLCSFFIGDYSIKIVLRMLPFRIYTNQLNNVIMIETPRKRNIATIILNCVDILLVIILMIAIPRNLLVLASFLCIKEITYLVIALIIVGKPKNNCAIHINLEELLKYGFFVMICLVMMEVNYRIDVIMLNGRVSDYQIGLYSVGVSLAERIWLVPDALRDILMSKLVHGKDSKEVCKVTRLSFSVSMMLVVFVSIMGKLLIRIMFGVDYVEAYLVTIILLAGVVSMVFYKTIYAYFNVNGKQNINLIILVSTAIVNIIGNIILIPTYGMYGAAFASVISYSICGLLFLIVFCNSTKSRAVDLIIPKKSDIQALFRK